MRVKSPIIYVRGLNTKGTDRVRWSRLDFGLYHGALQEAFHQRGATFFPITGLGDPSLPEKIVRLQTKVKDLVAANGKTRFHLLGHSSGGLAARILASKNHTLPLLSVTTIASPHKGSVVGGKVKQLVERSPLIEKTVRTWPGSLDRRIEIYDSYSPERVEKLLQYPWPDHLAKASITCSLPTTQLSWPLILAKKTGDFLGAKGIGDGIVDEASQYWGTHLAHYPLDHLSQIGLHFYSTSKARNEKRRLFNDMVDKIIEHLIRCEEESQL